MVCMGSLSLDYCIVALPSDKSGHPAHIIPNYTGSSNRFPRNFNAVNDA